MSTTTKRIIKLDASALSKSSCPLAFYRTVIEGYRNPTTYNDTQYGSAVHRFCAVMCYTAGNFSVAVQEAVKVMRKPCTVRNKKDHLNEKHLINTCLNYWEEYVSKDNEFEMVINPEAKCWKCNGVGYDTAICMECNGKGTRPQPMVEVNFDFPFYTEQVGDTEYEIRICGTIDRFGKFKNGCFAVRDYKTTSSWDLKKFFEPFKLRPQLKLYIWSLKKLAAANPDSQLAKIVSSTPIGACIDGIFLKSAKETTFQHSDVFIPKREELEKFEHLLWAKCAELVHLASHPLAADPLGMVEGTCHHIVPCDFFDVCVAVDEIASRHVLKNNFIQKPYDPLTFNE